MAGILPPSPPSSLAHRSGSRLAGSEDPWLSEQGSLGPSSPSLFPLAPFTASAISHPRARVRALNAHKSITNPSPGRASTTPRDEDTQNGDECRRGTSTREQCRGGAARRVVFSPRPGPIARITSTTFREDLTTPSLPPSVQLPASRKRPVRLSAVRRGRVLRATISSWHRTVRPSELHRSFDSVRKGFSTHLLHLNERQETRERERESERGGGRDLSRCCLPLPRDKSPNIVQNGGRF